jgi:hypothetical protein
VIGVTNPPQSFPLPISSPDQDRGCIRSVDSYPLKEVRPLKGAHNNATETKPQALRPGGVPRACLSRGWRLGG